MEAVWVRAPRLQCAAKHVKPLGRLMLGEALGCEIAILCEVSPLVAILALVAIIVAWLGILDDRSHSYLLLWPSYAFGLVIAKDGEGAFSFQRCVELSL